MKWELQAVSYLYEKSLWEKCTWWSLYTFYSAYSLPSAKWWSLSIYNKTVWQRQTLCSSHLPFPNLFKCFNEQSTYFFPIMKYNYRTGLLFRKPTPTAVSWKDFVLLLKVYIILTRKKFFPQGNHCTTVTIL